MIRYIYIDILWGVYRFGRLLNIKVNSVLVKPARGKYCEREDPKRESAENRWELVGVFWL